MKGTFRGPDFDPHRVRRGVRHSGKGTALPRDPSEPNDVIVVGGGNAALCAAISARENGANVTLLERAPQNRRGGNTYFTDGLMRTVYGGADDIRALCPDLTDDEVKISDFGAYTVADFFDDMGRITDYRTNPDLCEVIVRGSFETLLWMRDHGVRFLPNFGRQAYKIDGRFTFWGGATIAVADGGAGLVERLYKAAERLGVRVVYDARALELVLDGSGAVRGVRGTLRRRPHTWPGRAIVLGCGSFEANAEWRARYLGPGWDLAKVRGTRYNTGDGLAMAIAAGGSPNGHWSGCHATAWERNAEDFGVAERTATYQRHSYPLGIVVNQNGERFLDEGADFRNYTYAKYGRAILQQPSQVAWQIFDAKVTHLLRDEYEMRGVSKVEATTLEQLAARLDEVDSETLLATIKDFNAAVDESVPFRPNVRDGRSARGLGIPKSNWANRLDTPPFTAYAVTCGVTFAFGGMKVDTSAAVLDVDDEPIPGLFAAGEMVGGIFANNYPGGTGLTSGAVFGRVAGRSAATYTCERGGPAAQPQTGAAAMTKGSM